MLTLAVLEGAHFEPQCGKCVHPPETQQESFHFFSLPNLDFRSHLDFGLNK